MFPFTHALLVIQIILTSSTDLSFLDQAIGGAVWHGVKGFRNSPYGERRIGALTAIKARAPVLGGNFGVWGGLFSCFDCAIKGIRKTEDPWNSISAGFLTGGALAIRGGFKAARNSAIMCAVFLGVIEGVGIGFQRMMAENTKLEVCCILILQQDKHSPVVHFILAKAHIRIELANWL